MYDPNQYTFFGFMGVTSALVFCNLGAAYGTAKSGVGICSVGVLRPELVFRSLIPIIMAGILGIYGLIVAVILQSKGKWNKFDLYTNLCSLDNFWRSNLGLRIQLHHLCRLQASRFRPVCGSLVPCCRPCNWSYRWRWCPRYCLERYLRRSHSYSHFRRGSRSLRTDRSHHPIQRTMSNQIMLEF